jgi:hypothetical protein
MDSFIFPRVANTCDEQLLRRLHTPNLAGDSALDVRERFGRNILLFGYFDCSGGDVGPSEIDVAQELVNDEVREFKLEMELDVNEDEDDSAYSAVPYGPNDSGPQSPTVMIRLIIVGASISSYAGGSAGKSEANSLLAMVLG